MQKENSLAIKRPDLLKEWNYRKNGELRPEDITFCSGKKVWWQCSKNPKHEWQTTIASRKNGTNCPYCSGLKVCEDNSLATLRPDLAQEWHYKRNGKLTPEDVTFCSGKKVWWLCSKNPKHEWQTTIASRKNDTSCPYCNGQKVCEDNSLATLRPDLAQEWHPTKNSKTPHDFTCGSGQKVWWQCKRGHEWSATIGNRSYGTDCPKCKCYFQTSFPEQAIYFYIQKLFKNSINRYKIKIDSKKSIELDIYIPEINVGIEYDGYLYHKNSQKDEIKNNRLKEHLKLIRVREKGTPYISNGYVIQMLNKNDDSLTKAIKDIMYILKKDFNIHCELNIDIKRDRIKILELMDLNEKTNSLKEKFPLLAQEWHPTKNNTLTPDLFNYGSNIKVWWQCAKNNNHEWESSIANRTNGNGCPYCAGKKVCKDNCLATLRPELVKEWHPTKNSKTPHDFTCGSGQKVWWQCSMNPTHEWEAMIRSRTKVKSTGCPYCSGKKVCKDNALASLRPDIAKEWHPTKNDKTPYDFTCGSNKDVWWQCSNNPEHVWEKAIHHRTIGSSCPYCQKEKVKNKLH